MIVKKHVNEARLILAVCDSDLQGKKFEEEDCSLDLSGLFFQGKETDDETVKKLMLDSYIINIAGPKALELAQELDLVEEACVKYVDGIPHAQVLVIRED